MAVLLPPTALLILLRMQCSPGRLALQSLGGLQSGWQTTTPGERCERVCLCACTLGGWMLVVVA